MQLTDDYKRLMVLQAVKNFILISLDWKFFSLSGEIERSVRIEHKRRRLVINLLRFALRSEQVVGVIYKGLKANN